MTDLAHRGLVARAERLDRSVTTVQTRVAPMFPGGEVQETGHALWTLSTTGFLVVNGVIRYDARDFDGRESERDLDSCLAVLSTYEVPWRFSVWEHLGADRLMPSLSARGLTVTGRAEALWLDVRSGARESEVEDGIEIRPSVSSSDHRLWTRICVDVYRIPTRYADVFEAIVGSAHRFSAVAYADGRPAGFLSLAIEDGIAVVDNVGVLPTFRNRGVGRRLLSAAHEAVAAHGARACVVVANPAGSRVCAEMGYQVVTTVTHLTPARHPV
ncbi:MAG: GNAT family N-acetyltransferase [Dermatophilaceae bacterium]